MSNSSYLYSLTSYLIDTIPIHIIHYEAGFSVMFTKKWDSDEIFIYRNSYR